MSRSLNPNETNVHQWKANVSKIIGSHTLRFGGELNSSTFESLYNSANVGYAFQQTNDPSQAERKSRQRDGVIPAECSGQRGTPERP